MKQFTIDSRLLYIEPVTHIEYMCHYVYPKGRTVPSKQASDITIDHYLTIYMGANLKARRQQVKHALSIHKMIPIIIDESVQFVLFPITPSIYKNAFYINLRQVVHIEKDQLQSVIHFKDQSIVNVPVDFKTCISQYKKALHVLDYYVKMKEIRSMYHYAL